MNEIIAIIIDYLKRRHGEEGMLIAILITLLCGLHSFSRGRPTSGMRYAKLSLCMLILVALLFAFYPPLYNWQRDVRYSFNDSNKDNTINILISDFDSDPAQLGEQFTESFYQNMVARAANEKNIKIGDTVYNVRIDIKRTDQVWTEKEMQVRGRSRGADLGVMGIYIEYTTNGATTYDVESLQCVILDTSLAAVLESQKPVESLFDFSVQTDTSSNEAGLTLMVGKLSDPILYLSRLAINLQLLKIAHVEKDIKQQLKIRQRVNDGFAQNAELIKSRAIADFHQGNSDFRNAQLAADFNQRESYLHDAVEHYHASIDTFKKDTSIKVIQYDPVKPYFNLAETFRQLSSLTKKADWLDHAERTYEQAATNFPSLITAQELISFLEERLDFYSVDRGITAPAFRHQVEKYLKWNQALINYVKQSDRPFEERQNEIRELEKKRESWEERRRTYAPKLRH